MRNFASSEPVLTIAGVQAFLVAVLGLVTKFGVNLSADQTAAILAVYATGAPIVAALWARRRVTPVPTPAPGD